MSKNNQAIPWLLAWSLIHTLSISLSKALDPSINTLTIVFFRTFFGLIFLTPALIRSGFLKTLTPKEPLLISGRAFFMLLSMWCTYTAYRTLDLSVATTIGFTQSIIMATLAALILKERVSLRRWGVIFAGYAGVLFFTKSSGHWQFQESLFIALAANIFASLAIITTKKLTEKESPLTIIAIPLIVIMLTTAGANTYIGWNIPSGQTLLILVVIAGGLTFTQYAYVKALTYCQTSFSAPFQYLRLIIAIPIGCLYFCEILTINKVIGSLIIILSNFYLLKSNKA